MPRPINRTPVTLKSGVEARSLGQRQTPQRDAILRVIENASGPLSIPEIHTSSQKSMPKLGIATIYRTIKLLLEAEQIQTVILPSGEPRYERAGMGHHDHFQCRKCQHVFDLDICPSGLHNGMALPGGFVVEDHEMTVYGLCAPCSSPQKTATMRRALSGHFAVSHAGSQRRQSARSRAGLHRARPRPRRLDAAF